MGIKDMFKKRKQKAAEQKEYEQTMDGLAKVLALDPNGTFHFPESEDEDTVKWGVSVNLSASAVKAEVEEELILSDAYLAEKDGHIICTCKGQTLFSITSRSKAYAKLEEVAGHPVRYVTITKHDGDYGPYYKARLTFRVVPDEWSQHG